METPAQELDFKDKAEVIRVLRAACSSYCNWYDHGEPVGQTAENVAYQAFSACRIAWAHLAESSSPDASGT